MRATQIKPLLIIHDDPLQLTVFDIALQKLLLQLLISTRQNFLFNIKPSRTYRDEYFLPITDINTYIFPSSAITQLATFLFPTYQVLIVHPSPHSKIFNITTCLPFSSQLHFFSWYWLSIPPLKAERIVLILILFVNLVSNIQIQINIVPETLVAWLVLLISVILCFLKF